MIRETVLPDANAKRQVTFWAKRDSRQGKGFDPLIVAAAISLTHVLTASITNTFSCCLFCGLPTTNASRPRNLSPSQTHPLTHHSIYPAKHILNMSVVSLLGVEVKNNPARFDEPYEFEITFECLEQLQKGEQAHYYCLLRSLTKPRS